MARLLEVVGGVVASVVLAGCSARATTVSPTPPSRAHPRIVPWLAATRRIPDQLWPVQGPLDAPPCARGDIGRTIAYYEGATGNWLGGIRFQNIGTHPCTVAGTPTLTLFTASGLHVHARIQRSGEIGLANARPRWPGFPVVSLRRGQTVTAVWEVPDDCAGPAVATMEVGLPGVALRTSVPGRSLHVVCGAGGLMVDRLTPDSPPPRPPPVIPLTIHLNAPAVAQRGRPMDYVVTLTNPGRRTFRFGRCPGYWQGFPSGAKNEITVTTGWVLNCRQTPSIPAGGSASYRMRVAVPPGAKSGLEWAFEPVPSKPGVDVAGARLRFR